MSDFARLADLLFPNITETPADLEKRFPARPAGQIVTRIAPSPTGFLHIGTVFTAFVNERMAHGNGTGERGVFFLRIEDTDDKREVTGAARDITEGLKKFGITFDEGPIGADGADVGVYGPYTQSQRATLYHTAAKEMVRHGFAYPCFLTSEELEDIRTAQTTSKQPTGVYGRYATWRDATFAEVEKKITSGAPYVLRLRVPDDAPVRVTVEDLVRGKVETSNNYADTVLLKQNGIPTYHFAHCVDDYLMKTSHVIRADEWFPSLPLHLQLFSCMGWKAPAYAHISPLMKADGGSRRKLSKRKDPEANVEWFFSRGYPADGILEYLANIANSGFEDWHKAHIDKSWQNFSFHLQDMNPAGALTDLVKMDFVCQEWIARQSNETFFANVVAWANAYRPDFAPLLQKYPDYAREALCIERGTPKDPKRYHKWEDAVPQVRAFFDEEYSGLLDAGLTELPTIDKAVIRAFVEDYAASFTIPATEEAWFTQLKEIAKRHKFAEGNAQFKEGGYIGKIGDAAGILRVALLASRVTPNLWWSLRVMGADRAKKRFEMLVGKLGS